MTKEQELWEALTDNQATFYRLYRENPDPSLYAKNYKTAYNKTTAKEATCRANAYNLLKNPKVKALDKHINTHASKAVTKDEIISRLSTAMRTEGIKPTELTAITDRISKLLGFDAPQKQQTEHTYNWQELYNQLPATKLPNQTKQLKDQDNIIDV